MMNEWKITEIEKKINKKIVRKQRSIGIDVAEYHTGICVLDTNTKHLYLLDFFKIDISKKKDIIYKILKFYKEFKMIIKRIGLTKNDIVIVEDSHLRFNVWTLKMLVRFSTIVVLLSALKSDFVYFIQAIHARDRVGIPRKREKKVKVKEHVKKWIKEKFDIDIKDDDKADSFILALEGLIDEEE